MSQDSITPEIEEKLKSAIQWIPILREEIARVIVGQHYLVDRLLVGLLANGHVLLEGVPCLLYTSPSPRDRLLSRMPSSA